MKEFYLNQLDKQQQKVYQIIKSGVESLAAEFDVSAERIRQIEAKALQKMRGALVAA